MPKNQEMGQKKKEKRKNNKMQRNDE